MLRHRNLWLAWFALALSTSPALAYAHIHLGPNGEIVEHCAADEPDASGDSGAPHDHSKSDESTVAHCLYCAGFAAGVPLSQCAAIGPMLRNLASAPLVGAPLYVSPGRSSVRIAQPRAPPLLPLIDVDPAR